MIPYIIVHPLALGPLKLQPFGLLVATGVLVGIALVNRRARRFGVDVQQLESFLTWILVSGFIFGHVLDTVMYYPEELLTQPWRLFLLWEGLSSFGGFIGATLGAVTWKFYRTEPWLKLGRRVLLRKLVRREQPVELLPLSDLVMAVFPVAWIFGRMGCSVVHDHPGAFATTSSPLAVAFGSGPVQDFYLFALRYGSTPRYDLGLLEMLFAVVLSAGFALTWRRGGNRGWYVVAATVLYAPARFSLDFLRASVQDGGDVRYAGLTPAQWACLLLFLYGVSLAGWLVRRERTASVNA